MKEFYLKTQNLINDEINDFEVSKLILVRIIFVIELEKLHILPKNTLADNINFYDLNNLFRYINKKIKHFSKLFLKDISDYELSDEIIKSFLDFYSYDFDYNIFSEIYKWNLNKEALKKDGIYYTPETIVECILKNTLYNFKDKLKILDPSCGTGCFLIKCIDILYPLYNDSNTVSSFLYGVDLDEKSVEICKISLFLKLLNYDKNYDGSNLDENIRCGDTLIANKKISPKAFKYSKKFDIIIGNPPYVNIYRLNDNKKALSYYQKIYKSAFRKFDLYVLFIEKAIKLLKNNGVLAFIIPVNFTTQPYASKIRQIILNETKILKIIDLSDVQVFKKVSTNSSILILQKNKNNKNHLLKSIKNDEYCLISQDLFKSFDDYSFRLSLDNDNLNIINKIKDKSFNLGDICHVASGCRGIPQSEFYLNHKLDENSKRLVVGKNIKKHYISYTDLWINYLPKKLYNPMFPELFENEKIIFKDVSSDLVFAYDSQHYYTSHTASCCLLKTQLPHLYPNENSKFKLKYVYAFLSTKIVEFYFKILISSDLHVYVNDIRKLPLYDIDINIQNDFIEIIDEILKLVDEIHYYKNLFISSLNIDKPSRKIRYFNTLSYNEFDREFKNSKLFKDDFLKYSKLINILIGEVKKLDDKLNFLAYELYDFSDSEIEIIEKYCMSDIDFIY